jgi:hypothetical protein
MGTLFKGKVQGTVAPVSKRCVMNTFGLNTFLNSALDEG